MKKQQVQKGSMGEKVQSSPPEGVKLVGERIFYQFPKPGAFIFGTLLSPVEIKGRGGESKPRWRLAKDGQEYILPGHSDLDRKLTTIFDPRKTQQVWIQYLGQEPARTPSGYVCRYAVGIVEEYDDVPF